MKASRATIKLGEQSLGGCGLVFIVLFSLVFAGVGLMVTGLLVRDFTRTLRTYTWKATPCDIVSSGVVDTDAQGRKLSNFRFEVEYRYQVDQEVYTSRQFAIQTKNYSDYSEVQRLALKFAPGTQAVCFVNSSTPTEAILQRGSLWMGFTIFFPLIFVVIGGGLLFFTVRGAIRQRQGKSSEDSVKAGPISERARSGAGTGAALLLFGFFALIGGVITYFMAVRPALLILQARNWQSVPCEVVSSEVKTHQDSDGNTYSIDILYRYEVNGRALQANRYHFMGGSSSGRSGKQAVVNRYPPGLKTVCWVNPRDPTDAVLERGFTRDLLWGLLPSVFLLIGVLGLGHTIRKRKQPGRASGRQGLRQSPALAVTTPPEVWRAGEKYWDPAPRLLKPAVPPVGKLVGALIIAGFWNGIVSVFVHQIVQSWLRHRPDWFGTIFLIPFVVIGLGLIGYVLYTLLALLNARPRLTLTPGVPALGETLEVKWEFRGRTGVIRRLQIVLEGREEATYRRGTRTATDKSVMASIKVVDSTNRMDINAGQVRVTIPGHCMHSLAGTNNKIIWELRVHGEIGLWPDVKESFAVMVQPHKPEALKSGRSPAP